MSEGLNQCNFIGNLGADPELRQAAGKEVCNFRLAISESWSDGKGERQERTVWVRIVVWGKLAGICGKHLKKGRQVHVTARFRLREWTDKENRKQSTPEFEARDVVFLGRPSDAPQGEPAPAGGGGADDEIPF